MAIPELAFVENGIPYTRKEISFLVLRSTETPILNQFQKNLMDRILSTTSFARDHRRKQK